MKEGSTAGLSDCCTCPNDWGMLSCPTQGQAQTLQTAGFSRGAKRETAASDLEGLYCKPHVKTFTCPYFGVIAYCNATGTDVGKKCILKSEISLSSHLDELELLEDFKFTPCTLRYHKTKWRRNCLSFIAAHRGLWSWHIASINWRGGIWILVGAILILPSDQSEWAYLLSTGWGGGSNPWWPNPH